MANLQFPVSPRDGGEQHFFTFFLLESVRWRWWISDCLSFVKTRSTHLLIFTLGSSKSQSYNFYICCMLLVWWKRFPVDPVLWYLSPKKYFFPFPSIKTYSQCPHTKSTKIENSWLSNDVKCWIQMGRASLYKKPISQWQTNKKQFNFSAVLGSEYCSGYIDVLGKWNTGFYCPTRWFDHRGNQIISPKHLQLYIKHGHHDHHKLFEHC